MPWSKSNPPKGTDRMNARQRAACIAAANETLARTGDDGKAMQACFAAAGKVGYKPAAKEMTMDEANKIKWDTKYVNSLPDAAFAVIKSGGTKDKNGLTLPRSNRMLPHHTAAVKSATEDESVDKPHLRSALSRVAQKGTDLTPAERSKAKAHLDAHAKALKVGEKEVGYRGIVNAFYEQVAKITVPYSDGSGSYQAPEYEPNDVFPGWILLNKRNDPTGLYRMTYTVDDRDEVTFSFDAVEEVKIEYVKKSFRSFKASADGPWMWVGITASSFKDRDGEIISNKALDAAIAIADETGEHGPLRVYHTKGTDVGRCLVSARSGNFLVEAGTWDDSDMAVKARTWVEAHPDEAGVSIGFTYQGGDKRKGVYVGPIEIQERSLLALKDAACPWTALMNVSEEGDEMENAREKLAAIIGEEMATTVVKEAEDRTETLTDQGVAFKGQTGEAAATEPPATDQSEPPAPETPATAVATLAEETPTPPETVLMFDQDNIKSIATSAAELVAEKIAPLAARLEVVEGMTKALVDAGLASHLGTIETALADIRKTDEQKIRDRFTALPRATIRSIGRTAEPTEPDKPNAEVDAAKAADSNKPSGSIFSNLPSLAEQAAQIRAARQQH